MPSRIRAFPNIGHRGAPVTMPPGNTVASLEKAVEIGVHMLEVDLRCTYDNIIILEHEGVRMIGDREVPIRERTYAEWKAYHTHTDAPLATLDDAFEIAKRAEVGLMLDFKAPGYEAVLARAIRRSGFPLDALLVSGAEETSRTIIRGLDPRIPLCLTLELEDAGRLNAKLLSQIDTDAVNCHHRLLTPAIVQILHMREILVYAGPVDLSEDMRKMRTLGVDGIITNFPDLLRKI